MVRTDNNNNPNTMDSSSTPIHKLWTTTTIWWTATSTVIGQCCWFPRAWFPWWLLWRKSVKVVSLYDHYVFHFSSLRSPSDARILKQDLQYRSPPTFDGTSSQSHQLSLRDECHMMQDGQFWNASEKPLHIMRDPMRAQRGIDHSKGSGKNSMVSSDKNSNPNNMDSSSNPSNLNNNISMLERNLHSNSYTLLISLSPSLHTDYSD